MQKFAFLVFIICSFTKANSQDSIAAPYLRFPSFPPVKLLKADSSGFYKKADLPDKKKIMLVIFNPQCDHCQHEAETLSKNLDKFEKTHIVMAAIGPLAEINDFARKYNLANKSNIQFTQDTHYFLLSFYNLSNLPFHAFYNKKKELISVKQGSLSIDKILTELDK